jgi:hypothetical protein
VESQVKTWSFPVAETATTVHIPFRFEKQR